MKYTPADVAAFGIFACAAILSGVVVKREFGRERPPVAAPRRVTPSPAVVDVGRVIGPEEARVQVVVFSDFQCPYCAKAQPVLDSLRQRHAGVFKLRYRHLPLETLHPHAWNAALASECAGDQGRFGEYHDLLFAKQDSIGLISWSEFATRASVRDGKEFSACLASERHNSAIERDVLLARSLEVRGTPAFIVGNELFEGVPPLQWFERRVSKAASGPR